MTDDYSTSAPDGAPVRPGYANPKGKRVREPMDVIRFQGIVKAMIDDAESYVDEVLAPDRTKAAEYYYGEPMGNEIEGRSTIVMTEVHDVVMMMMPGLVRVFAGNQQVVEFEPVGPEDVENAKQATDYMDYVFMRDNPGFRILHDAALDGLVRKTGIFKWWFEKSEEVIEEEYTGLTAAEAQMLTQDPDVEIVEVIPDDQAQPYA